MIEAPLTSYVRALRMAGARVSAAETIDAMRTVALVGYGDRALLKESLGAVLAKSVHEKSVHDRLFDLHFGAAMLPEPPAATANKDGDGHENAADAAGERAGDADPQSGGAPAGGGGGGDRAESLLALANSGDPGRMALALERAAAAAGVDSIRFRTQSGWFARRMLEEMGVEALETRMLERFAERTEAGRAAAQEMIDARSRLTGLARELVDRRFDLFGASATDAFMDDVVTSRRLDQVDRRDLARMQHLVAKLAKRLAERHARRLRRRNRGRLDVARTLHASTRYDGVPFDVVWKTKRRDRPRIVAICDVSGSVARYVQVLLLFLHALSEKVADLRSFAFSARLHDVGDLLEQLPFDAAMARILREAGGGMTDYGRAFADLDEAHHNAIDRRTTVLILGDGRSNHAEPRIDLLRDMAGRAKRLVWLCPEPPSRWGTGDSVMLDYRPWCTRLGPCATLADLENAIDDILLAYG